MSNYLTKLNPWVYLVPGNFCPNGVAAQSLTAMYVPAADQCFLIGGVDLRVTEEVVSFTISFFFFWKSKTNAREHWIVCNTSGTFWVLHNCNENYLSKYFLVAPMKAQLPHAIRGGTQESQTGSWPMSRLMTTLCMTSPCFLVLWRRTVKTGPWAGWNALHQV